MNVAKNSIGAFLAAALFFFTPAAAGAVAALSLQNVTITDLSDAAKTTFTSGDDIRYSVTVSADVVSIVLASGSVRFASGQTDALELRLEVLEAGEHTISWDSTVPESASGAAAVEVTVLTLPGWFEQGQATFSVTEEPGDDDDDADEDPTKPLESSSFVCSACHRDTYVQWQVTRHFSAIGCEVCHGSGSDHVRSMSPDDIEVPVSSQLCDACHARNDGTVIEVEDGLIKPLQQKNELDSSPHAGILECLDCHNPHYSPSMATRQAIKVSCNDCHSNKQVYLNMQELSCQDCHMPYAAAKDESYGSGAYRRGDRRSHIWRIKGDAEPEEMFTDGGTTVNSDFHGAFLTVNFACLACHDGGDASKLDFESARQTNTLIH